VDVNVVEVEVEGKWRAEADHQDMIDLKSIKYILSS
jgi:hypothetical protein